jgi:hypothetical protein
VSIWVAARPRIHLHVWLDTMFLLGSDLLHHVLYIFFVADISLDEDGLWATGMCQRPLGSIQFCAHR